MSNQEGKVSRETRGHIFLIGLDRAAKRNAFDSHLIKDLSQALTEYESLTEKHRRKQQECFMSTFL